MSEKREVKKPVYEKVKQFGRVCAVRQVEPPKECRVAEKNKNFQKIEIKRK